MIVLVLHNNCDWIWPAECALQGAAEAAKSIGQVAPPNMEQNNAHFVNVITL